MFHYDVELGLLATAIRVGHSVVPFVVKRYDFWVFLFIHIIFVVLFKLEVIQTDAKTAALDWKCVQVTTAITSFFEVFYTNECYSRYLQLYKSTRQLLVIVSTSCYDLRVHAKENFESHARVAARYFLASTLTFFDYVNDDHQVAELSTWTGHMKEQLILQDEFVFLQNYDFRRQYLLLMHWSAEVLICVHELQGVPASIMKGFVAKIHKVGAIMQEVQDTLILPVPFQYFHLLNMMICVNLLLWAYVIACNRSYYSIIMYLFVEVIFMGMMRLASQLSDPFGDDDVDFPIRDWLRELFDKAEIMLEYGCEEVSGSGPRAERWQSQLGRVKKLTDLVEKTPARPFQTKYDWPWASGLKEQRAESHAAFEEEEEESEGNGGQPTGWVSASSWKDRATGNKKDYMPLASVRETTVARPASSGYQAGQLSTNESMSEIADE